MVCSQGYALVFSPAETLYQALSIFSVQSLLFFMALTSVSVFTWSTDVDVAFGITLVLLFEQAHLTGYLPKPLSYSNWERLLLFL